MSEQSGHWWRIEWGRAVLVSIMCCLIDLCLYKDQAIGYVPLGIGIFTGTIISEFCFVRKAGFSERMQRVSFAQAFLTGIFSLIFIRAFHS